MAKRWTKTEEKDKRKELLKLYVKENKTISEISKILKTGESTIYDRIMRLGLTTLRHKKLRYNNRRNDITLPKKSSDLAEFIGILLGDGHINKSQITITLGKKDKYVDYVIALMKKLFGPEPKMIILKGGNYVIYLGSTVLVRWFLSMGLVYNKVQSQVDIPSWVILNSKFMKAVLRGLFDTDGSVYKLKFGTQISFCNHSKPLVKSVRKMLLNLGFHPSRINGKNLYLTRQKDLIKFFKEIGFKNLKHRE